MGHRSLALFMLLTLGCSGGDKESGGGPVDEDGDGFTTDDDCDDSRADVFPGAEEACDGVDNDCDGDADLDDVDVTGYGTWHVDSDLDGYGDAVNVTNACERPDNAVDDATDCDDRDDTVNPGAEELCDGEDNDCDGLVDSDDTNVTGISTWGPDADGDGYGDASQAVISCENPDPAYVENGLDCDDGEAAINPAAPEICGDGIDWDCDGSDSPLVLAGDTTTDCSRATYVGLEGQSIGDALSAGLDATGDGVGEVALGASGGAAGLWSALPVGRESLAEADGVFDLGAGPVALTLGHLDGDVGGLGLAAGETVYLYNAPLTGAFGASDAFAAVSTGASIVQIALPGSVYGDAGAELAVAHADGVALYGGPLPSAALVASWTAGSDTVTGLVPAGDVDGDGTADLLVGLSTADEKGKVALLYGPWDGSGPADSEEEKGQFAGDQLGAGLSPGMDADGDGYADLFIGAPGATYEGADGAGKAYLVAGPATGGIDLVSTIMTLGGEAEGDEAGAGLALLGDFNEDGTMDYGVGAPGAAGGDGRGYLVLGPVTGAAGLKDVAYTVDADVAGARLGAAVAATGDLSADGRTDVLFGAPGAEGFGAAYLFLGSRF